MNRSTLFVLGVGAAAICVILAILFWAGVMPPDYKVHIKHGILLIALAVVAGIFAAVNRPIRSLS